MYKDHKSHQTNYPSETMHDWHLEITGAIQGARRLHLNPGRASPISLLDSGLQLPGYLTQAVRESIKIIWKSSKDICKEICGAVV